MSAVADAPPTGWGPLFEAQPTDEVIQARDAAGWLLNDVRAHPTAYHADLATVLAEVAEEADLALATRPAVAVARRIGVDLELIKQRLDVAGYIAHRAPGVRFHRGSRGNLRARCPFPEHEDDEPSFSVNPGKGLWRCFGCGRGGDVFTFCMYWDGVSFREAIAELAREAGVACPSRTGHSQARVGTVRVG